MNLKLGLLVAAVASLVLGAAVVITVNFSVGNFISQVSAELSKPWIEVMSPGVFELEKDQQTLKRELKTGDEIGARAVIKSDKTGLGNIYFPDGSVARLDANSVIIVEAGSFNPKTETLVVKLKLVSGRVWSKIIALATPDSSWEVKTSNAVATVRGTAFGITLSQCKSRVLVSEHIVAVNLLDSNSQQSDKPVLVPQDNYLDLTYSDECGSLPVKSVDEAVVKPVTPEIKNEAWVQKSEAADQIINQQIAELKSSGLDEKSVREEFRKSVQEKFIDKIQERKAKNAPLALLINFLKKEEPAEEQPINQAEPKIVANSELAIVPDPAPRAIEPSPVIEPTAINEVAIVSPALAVVLQFDPFASTASGGVGGGGFSGVGQGETTNQPPIAESQSVSIDEDVPVTIILKASDRDGDKLNYILIQKTASGTLSEITGNEIIYTPNPDYNGKDSFMFKATDGNLESETAVVSITVTAVNDAPTADSQSLTINEDESVIIALSGSDKDSNILNYSVVASSTNGDLVLAGNLATYTPNANYYGSDSFIFKVNDGFTDSTTTVYLTINPVNDALIADSQSVSLNQGESADITLSGSDAEGDELVFSLGTAIPSYGMLSEIFDGNQVTYTPNENYFGADEFIFQVSDGANTATATVNLVVNGLPSAESQTVILHPDSVNATISLSGSDPENDSLVYSIDEQPYGTLSEVIGNEVVYTFDPDSDEIEDSFSFKVNDGKVDSETAWVTVLINNQPITASQSTSLLRDSSATITFDASDADGDYLTYILVSNASHGVLSEISGNEVIYTPELGFVGEDSFTIKANDGLEDSEPVEILILVVANMDDMPPVEDIVINNAPAADDLTISLNEDESLDIELSGSDPENDPLEFIIVSWPTNGAINDLDGEEMVYVPNLNFNGSDSFTFKVNDGQSDSNVAVVVITINPVPDPASLSVVTDIDLKRVSLTEGDLVGFTAMLDMDDGSQIDVTAEAIWEVMVDVGSIEGGNFVGQLTNSHSNANQATGYVQATWISVEGEIFIAQSETFTVKKAPGGGGGGQGGGHPK
ncbi:MAG: Ig-like domain-containing protein [bacterium]|nr:Ig-like domain-containing protein [bacterium]